MKKENKPISETLHLLLKAAYLKGAADSTSLNFDSFLEMTEFKNINDKFETQAISEYKNRYSPILIQVSEVNAVFILIILFDLLRMYFENLSFNETNIVYCIPVVLFLSILYLIIAFVRNQYVEKNKNKIIAIYLKKHGL